MSVRDKVTDFMIAELKKFYPDWSVMRAKQDYPQLPEQYITVDLMAERSIGNQERWNVPDEEIAIVGLCEATFNIQAFGSGAIETIAMLSCNLERPSVVDEFYIANIAVNGIEDVQDLTDLLDDRSWEERASVDLTISYDRSVIDNPGWFDVLVIKGVLKAGADGKTPQQTIFSVSADIDIEKEEMKEWQISTVLSKLIFLLTQLALVALALVL